MTVRVRFAPSPTGHLHIGSLRAALFNWLYARHTQGTFLLRIEDTDLERSKPEYTASILDSFAWAGISSDEPIIIQSERLDIYRSLAHKLVQENLAYICVCTTEELQSRLGPNATEGLNYTFYDRRCRDLKITAHELKNKYIIRFKVPENQERIIFHDLIRGEISFDSALIDDFIIIRSDTMPMYNFAVVIDDALMRISHVIRGEEHINNTPKQILLYKALGYKIPSFAHLPLILGPDGHKLSKRDAAIAVLDYKKNGYLAEALINYLVRLGWSYGDQEIFTLQELINNFSLDSIGKKGAVFDIKKLEWLNTVYIKRKSGAELLSLIVRDCNPEFLNLISNWKELQVINLLEIYKERVKTLSELARELTELHKPPQEYNKDDYQAWVIPDTKLFLDHAAQQISCLDNWTVQAITIILKQICTNLSIKVPQLAQPLRLALTGKSASPGIFELIYLLGKQETLKRIETFKKNIV